MSKSVYIHFYTCAVIGLFKSAGQGMQQSHLMYL
jgi:hypothetical protein